MAEKKTKLTRTFLCMIALRNKTVADTFLPSFDNANGRLFQRKIVEFQESYYHGNLTSHLSWNGVETSEHANFNVSRYVWSIEF